MIDLIGASYQLNQRNQSSQRVINWFVEDVKAENEGAKSKYMLSPIPGATLALTITDDPDNKCRGLYYSTTGTAPTFEGRLYGVWGSSVYRFSVDMATPYLIGTISPTASAISMTDNGLGGYFAIVDGEKMYKYPLDATDGDATVLTEVILPYAAGSVTERIRPTHIAFLGQRIWVNNQYGNQFYFSNLGSVDFDLATNLNWYSAESNADPINAVKAISNALVIYGPRSFEIWRSSDNNLDPLSYVGGSSSMIGCKAPQSIASINDMTFWLGGSDVGSDSVFMLQGNTPTRISTMAIDDQILSCTYRENAIGWAYANKGNLYYILSFTASNRSFCYDHSTGKWHERLARDLATSEWKVYPYVYGTFASGKIYCGTLDGSNLVYLDETKYTEWDGNQVVRQLITQNFNSELNNVMIKEIVLDGQVGVTPLLSGLGSDPKIILQMSKDGGNTFGNYKEKSVGRQGNYRKMVRWNALGIGREIVFKFSISDPIPYSIYQLRLDYASCSRT